MKTLVSAVIAIATISISTAAYAYWVSATSVSRVRIYNDTAPYVMDIWFADQVASGCTDNTKIKLVTSDAELFSSVRQIVVAARLSGRTLEVSTIGCEGNYGKLDYLSLK